MERVSADEVTVDYANDLDTAECAARVPRPAVLCPSALYLSLTAACRRHARTCAHRLDRFRPAADTAVRVPQPPHSVQVRVGLHRQLRRVGPAPPVRDAPQRAAAAGVQRGGSDVPVAVLRRPLLHLLLARGGPLPVQRQLPAHGGSKDLVRRWAISESCTACRNHSASAQAARGCFSLGSTGCCCCCCCCLRSAGLLQLSCSLTPGAMRSAWIHGEPFNGVHVPRLSNASSSRQCKLSIEPSTSTHPRLECPRALRMACLEQTVMCKSICGGRYTRRKGVCIDYRAFSKVCDVLRHRRRSGCAGTGCRARTRSDWRRRCVSTRRRGSSRSATCCTTWSRWPRRRCSPRKARPTCRRRLVRHPRALLTTKLSNMCDHFAINPTTPLTVCGASWHVDRSERQSSGECPHCV